MSKSKVIWIAVAAGVVLLALQLNPSPEQHRAKIKEAISERSPLAGALGLGGLTAFGSTYHPLGIASYATVNGRTVSVGAFGVVFVIEPSLD